MIFYMIWTWKVKDLPSLWALIIPLASAGMSQLFGLRLSPLRTSPGMSVTCRTQVVRRWRFLGWNDKPDSPHLHFLYIICFNIFSHNLSMPPTFFGFHRVQTHISVSSDFLFEGLHPSSPQECIDTAVYKHTHSLSILYITYPPANLLDHNLPSFPMPQTRPLNKTMNNFLSATILVVTNTINVQKSVIIYIKFLSIHSTSWLASNTIFYTDTRLRKRPFGFINAIIVPRFQFGRNVMNTEQKFFLMNKRQEILLNISAAQNTRSRKCTMTYYKP